MKELFPSYPKVAGNRDDMIKSIFQNIKGLGERRLWTRQVGAFSTGQMRDVQV